MVSGEELTIHRRLSGDRFDSVVNVSGVQLKLKRGNSYTNSVLKHAREAAGEADSDTCGLDEFQLPNVVSIVNSRKTLVGYSHPSSYLRDCAVKRGDGGVVVSGEIFEAGFDSSGSLLKVCFRYPYSEGHDQIGVVKVSNQKFVTAWINSRNDSHRTLERDEYDSVEDVMIARSGSRTNLQ